MVIFHSYGKLPEGIPSGKRLHNYGIELDVCLYPLVDKEKAIENGH